MTHLGDRVSAYVDGQLPAGLTERVTAHLAACPQCRAAVERERRVKHALTAMLPPAPGTDFMVSLVALGGPAGPVAPRTGHVPGNPRPPLVMFEADVRRDPRMSLAPIGPAARGVLRRRWGGALFGAVTVVGAGVLSATFLPGAGTGATPLVRPPVGNLAVTPGSPPVPQNVGRRLGGGSRTTSSPLSTPSWVGTSTWGAASTGSEASAGSATSAPPWPGPVIGTGPAIAIAWR